MRSFVASPYNMPPLSVYHDNMPPMIIYHDDMQHHMQQLGASHTCLLRDLVSSILQALGGPVSACLQALTGPVGSRLQLLLVELLCLGHSVISNLLGTSLALHPIKQDQTKPDAHAMRMCPAHLHRAWPPACE